MELLNLDVVFKSLVAAVIYVAVFILIMILDSN